MKADLARRMAAGSVVITPNRRLAAHLKREFDLAQVGAGRAAWRSAECLPLNAFLESLYGELTRLHAGATLLSAQQEAALWERVIQESSQAAELLSPFAAAGAARDAHLLERGYRLGLGGLRSTLGEDGRAYLEWAGRFEEIMRERRWLDAARLPDAIVDALALDTTRAPRALTLFGFDQFTLQHRALFQALAAHGWDVVEVAPGAEPGNARRTGYADRDAELAAVAQQVKDALRADAGQRIGIIVPELAAARGAVARVLDDVLEPARILTGARESPRPYNLSLGVPLLDYPLVHSALLILELARGELSLEAMGSLLRSPFLAGAEQELAARAALDAELRRDGRPRVDLGALARRSRDRAPSSRVLVPQLSARLANWAALAPKATSGKRAFSQWSLAFQKLLAGLGWPGERTLDSTEYQTFEKWREIVASLSALDVVAPQAGYDEALRRLRRIAADSLFQPESPEVPVQVLGVLEAHALDFDRLFVTGLTDEAWPPPPRPNPFLPVALQRAHGMPHASAEWQIGYARRAMKLWAAGRAVCLSWPQREGDRELRMSPLLRGVPEAQPGAGRAPLVKELMHAARNQEDFTDFTAPPLPGGIEVTGGAAFFQNQAACPFKAFATHRLGASALENGRVGLDARERGGLVHMAACNLWRELQTHEALCAASSAQLEESIGRAVAGAVDHIRRRRPDVMTPAFTALEAARVAALFARLLALEKSRPPFAVLACEDRRSVSVAGVQVTTRLDRVDRLADGGEVILDYKTSGEVNLNDWLGPRPEEPQLPLYATGTQNEVAAVAFVQLHPREVRFEGLSRNAGALPGVAALADAKKVSSVHADWVGLLGHWRAVLETLAREYLAGRADVAPKAYPDTCKYCELGPLCRVKEMRDRGPMAERADDDE